MHILFAQYLLELPCCHSLKEKRSVLKRILHAIRSEYNVSVVESGEHDLWQSARLAMVTCAVQREGAERVERSISDLLDSDPDARLLEVQREWL